MNRHAPLRNAPANGVGYRRSLLCRTICGPMMADAIPPINTREIARDLSASSTKSEAANRYCCTKLFALPARINPTQNQIKLCKRIAAPAIDTPTNPKSAPAIKPRRLPILNISNDAGPAIRAIPTLKPLTGSVASDLSSASRYAPAKPPSEITIGAIAALIALKSAYRLAIARVFVGNFIRSDES